MDVRKLLCVLVILCLCVLTASYSFRLFTGSYRISEPDLVLIDTFRLQARAYYHPGGKSGTSGYHFKSTNGYSFAVEKAMYHGVTDKKALADTLLYHDLPFIAYSDRATYHKYKHRTRRLHINLLQLQVGSVRYIDLEKANRSEWIGLMLRTFIAAGFLLLAMVKTRKVFRSTHSGLPVGDISTADARTFV